MVLAGTPAWATDDPAARGPGGCRSRRRRLPPGPVLVGQLGQCGGRQLRQRHHRLPDLEARRTCRPSPRPPRRRWRN
jgi:hypothetical protein